MSFKKLDGQSADIASVQKEKLKQLFPEAFAEGKIDFNKLKATLGEEVELDERYGLSFKGKSNVFRAIKQQTTSTLVPERSESVNFDETENVFIEGDNLEVLKVLQKSYYEKIKMIYIDPPYNTGNDFIYNDKFAQTRAEHEAETGERDDNGNSTRSDGLKINNGGHKHSNWLTMMYPRLFLAKNLLRQDGVIFISIDDNEVHNLRLIMDEIFGEENFLGLAGRVAKKSNNKGEYWSPNFDYILTYAKNISNTKSFTGGINTAAYDLVDSNGPRAGEKYQLLRLYMSNIENRNPEQRFYIDCPDGTKIIPPGTTFPPERPVLGDGIWRWTKKKIEAEKERIVVKKVKSSNLIDENGSPAMWNVYTKTYLNDVIENNSAKPNSLIESQINQLGTVELRELNIPFDYPKPSSLIEYLINISHVGNEDIVLDFFGGSGSSAHAVMRSSAKNDENIKYILIQLPEETDKKSEEYKAGYKSITDIAKERIRRSAKKIQTDYEGTKFDSGFKVYKSQATNFKVWNNMVEGEERLKQALLDHLDPIKEGGQEEDLLTELVVKSGLSLTTKQTKIKIDEGAYYKIENIIYCLEKAMTTKLFQVMLAESLTKIIILDSSLKNNDQLKTNLLLQAQKSKVEVLVV